LVHLVHWWIYLGAPLGLGQPRRQKDFDRNANQQIAINSHLKNAQTMVRLLAQQNGHNGSTSGVVPPIPITIVIHSILPVYQEDVPPMRTKSNQISDHVQIPSG
jgi:hypothetical protein